MFGAWLKEIPKEVLNYAGSIIALALVGLLFFMSWALVFRQLPAENREAMLMLLGIISTNVGSVVGWFFGTSYSSQKKTEAISNLTKGAP